MHLLKRLGSYFSRSSSDYSPQSGGSEVPHREQIAPQINFQAGPSPTIKVQNIVIAGGVLLLFFVFSQCRWSPDPSRSAWRQVLRALPTGSNTLWRIPTKRLRDTAFLQVLEQLPLGAAQIQQDARALAGLWSTLPPTTLWASPQARNREPQDLLYLLPLPVASDTTVLGAYFSRRDAGRKSQFLGHTVYQFPATDSTAAWALAQVESLLLLARIPLHLEAALERLKWADQPWLDLDRYWARLSTKEGLRVYTRTDGEVPPRMALSPEYRVAPEPEVLWMDWHYYTDSLGLGVRGQMIGSEEPVESPDTTHPHALADLLPKTTLFYHWNGAVTLPEYGEKARGDVLPSYLRRDWRGELAWGRLELGSTGEKGYWYALRYAEASSARRAQAQYLAKRGELEAREYQSFPYYRVLDGRALAVFSTAFNHFLADPFLLVLDDWLLLLDSRATLESWIDQYLTGNTLARQVAHQQWQNAAAERASGQCFVQWSGQYSPRDWPAAIWWGPDREDGAEWGRGWAVQRLGRRRFAGRFLGRTAPESGTRILWKKALRDTIRRGPQVFYNPRRQAYDLLAEDGAGRLYLLDEAGELRWQRSFEAGLRSPLTAVDYFRDDRVQYVFNDSRRLYLIDDRGRDVGLFPLELGGTTEQPVRVVDFQGRGDYAFFLAGPPDRLFAWDRTGSPLPGWNPLRVPGGVAQPVVHTVFENRDYLLVLTGTGQLRAYARDGHLRFATEGLLLDPTVPLLVEEGAGQLRILGSQQAGTLAVINERGEWFGLPFPAAERRGLLLATLAGEGAMNYVGWSGADLVGYHYTAAGRFERAWRRGLAAEADTVFRVAVPGRQTDFLGWCDRSSGRIDLIGGGGGPAEGFPLAGTGAFRLVAWGERLVLLVANGASVYAYQLGGLGEE